MDPLKKSPLIEAVCEIVFVPTGAFDLTVPGMLYAALKENFPIKKERPLIQIPVRNMENIDNLEILQSPVTQFYSPDQKKIVQVGKDLLVNNVVFAYQGWSDFLGQILHVLNLYNQNNGHPAAIRQITLKYLNRFDVSHNTPFSELFAFPLPNPSSEKYSTNRSIQTLVEYASGSSILSKILKTVVSRGPDVKSYVLEIQYINNIPDSIKGTDIEAWLTNAHDEIEQLFQCSLNHDYLESLK